MNHVVAAVVDEQLVEELRTKGVVADGDDSGLVMTSSPVLTASTRNMLPGQSSDGGNDWTADVTIAIFSKQNCMRRPTSMVVPFDRATLSYGPDKQHTAERREMLTAADQHLSGFVPREGVDRSVSA